MSWRRILLFSLIFVVALGASTWGYLQHSDAATRMLRNELQRLLAAPSRLDTTSIDLAAGRLSANGLPNREAGHDHPHAAGSDRQRQEKLGRP